MADDVEDALEDDGRPGGYDRRDVESVVAAIIADDGKWSEGKPLVFGNMKWRPHLSSGTEHLHVHLASGLMPYMLDRLATAYAHSSKVHIALPLPSLYDEALLRRLAPMEPEIHLVKGPDSVGSPESLLEILGQRLRVGSDTRTDIARSGFALAQADGTAHEKGKRLESLLCFLFGQVSDFEVSDVRLDTATEELDLVITVRANSGRCWVLAGAPFVLVEAKNWHTSTVGQFEVSGFAFKAEHKRGTVRLGIMVGMRGFSPEAKDQTLRTSAEKLTVALFGPQELEQWIDAESSDDVLENLIRKAMLY